MVFVPIVPTISRARRAALACTLAACLVPAPRLVAQAATARRPAPAAATDRAPRDTGEAALVAAARRQARNLPIEVTARVVKLLKDDRFGIQHQKFLVTVGGLTVLVAHNLDLAPRAPVQAGSTVRLRGEYVWNEKGGVIHWTHHDPRGRHAAGFIEVNGQKVQ